MLAIFICASLASVMLGKKVMKSLYSLSACAMAADPPSAYQESPMASLTRATYSESGYVLISVCKLSRATSNLLCFMASMARSNSTLSGCLESTLAIGFCAFLLFFLLVLVDFLAFCGAVFAFWAWLVPVLCAGTLPAAGAGLLPVLCPGAVLAAG